MLLTNAQVYCDATDTAPHSEIALNGAYVGTHFDGPKRDLGGRIVLPGLTDAHLHIFPLALFRLQLDIAAARITSIPALIDALHQVPDARRHGGWLQAAVLVEDTFTEARLPTRAELDAAFPDTPVFLRRYCGHVAILNTAALNALGLLTRQPNVASGSFRRDAAGNLTGQADEAAAAWIFARAPAPPDAQILSEISAVIDQCLAYGLTSLVEAAVGFTLGYDREAAIWTKLRAAGNIPVRLGFMNELTTDQAAARALTPQWDANWSSETLKFFADGIIGGRTGALSEPYCDIDTMGDVMHPPGVLQSQLTAAHAAGWRIAVHATGDRGISQTLDAITAAQGDDTSRRHRIEHFFVAPKGGLHTAANAGINVVTQPGFLHRMGTSIARGLGPRALGCVYPGASALAANVALAFSSDAPTGPLSPWDGIAAAITRRAPSGEPIGPSESLPFAQALNAYISGGAHAMRHDHFRSTLAPGQAADLVVLNMNPFTASPDELNDCRADLVMKDGKVVKDDL
ncbi:amidohydrolase [Shimia abyssi]|uniref:Amidohydrolase 3 domain-containing protein n=1 Tax=Shimia abyssi TaxID=1662395 RepID=A0A2P8F5W0_9RHOB|nr:amidohydrolase [Shimia abyssi]PSL17097.1 hypothetical protein CLV88_1217 [Shimia abyssi]